MFPSMRIGMLVLAVAWSLCLWHPGLAVAVEIALVQPDYFAEEDMPLQGGPKVARKGDAISVTLNNGCVIALDIAQNALKVTNAEGVTILANNPGQIVRIKYIPAGMGPDIRPTEPKLAFRFDRLTSYGEAVMFRFVVTGEDKQESTLDWSFQPLRRKINGDVYDGVGDTFTITDRFHHLHEITLFGLAATGDEFDGARTIRMACFGQQAGRADVTFGKERHDLGWWGAFIDGGQFFHVVGQKQGTVYEYLDDECHDMTNIRSNGANNAVEIAHTILVGRVPSLYHTPQRVRLFTKRALSPQLWMELARSRRQALAAKYRVPPTPMRPILMARNFWYATPFEEYAAANLPTIRDMGWRRMEIGWVYHRGWAPARGHAWPSGALYNDAGKAVAFPSRQSEYKDRLLENYGGAAALKAFVDRAHQQKIEVYFWHQMAHGWLGSDDVRNHPDWVVHDFQGKPVAGSYAESLVFFDLRSGFRDATLERIRAIKEQTGVDGFWLDMYGSGLHQSPNYINLVASPTVTERMDYVRRMREMGLGLYAEGVSSALIDSFVLWNAPNWQDNEFILYGSSPFVWERKKFDQLAPFKLMSFQCFPTDTTALLQPTKDEATKQWIEAIRHRNRCFNLIEDTLGQPIGVVTIPGGTQWVHARGNTLFFHDEAKVEIKPPRKIAKAIAVGLGGEVPIAVGADMLKATMPARSILILVFE